VSKGNKKRNSQAEEKWFDDLEKLKEEYAGKPEQRVIE